eukprot:CAMPEP_0198433292 /NCGR_PEP_ID=MMETSP1452-20131203/26060_1 /TAXON_ID=1181717 /ORGANISM="Synchroma pusillum, Strain CCMP3072" /LENGTH=81 /DNA_ID=CAMNT_0044153785 /DNA_START=1 /DNA_END=243 /DNA_ORIENTATION=+
MNLPLLKFWLVLGLLNMIEGSIEPLVRWLPGWSFCKFWFIVLTSIPETKVADLAFMYVVVPSIRRLHELAKRTPSFVDLLA